MQSATAQKIGETFDFQCVLTVEYHNNAGANSSDT